MTRSTSMAGALLVLLGVTGAARADNPTFNYGTYEEKKTVEWKANASAGLLLTTGNANQVSFTAAAMASRNDGHNKLQLDVNGAYARATIVGATDTNANGVIDPGEVTHTTARTAALWNVKLRYDRFFSANNSLYLTGFAWGNDPAGKHVVAGGQAGYARQIYKNDIHQLNGEVGYDFSYERFVSGDLLNYYLHSLRLYVGYDATLSKDTTFHVGVEYLGNFNPYNGPYPNTSGMGNKRISSFGDSRVNGNASLTTRIWKKLAFRISFTAKYDNVPAPLAISGAKFAPGFVPPSQKLDTITDASLVVTFL